MIDGNDSGMPALKKASYNPYPRVRRRKAEAESRSKRDISSEALDALKEFTRTREIVKCPTAYAFGAREPKAITTT